MCACLSTRPTINRRSCGSVRSGSLPEHHLHSGGGWIKAPSPSQPWLKAAVADMKLKVTQLINCPPPPGLRECSPKIKCLAGGDGALLRPWAVSCWKASGLKAENFLLDASTYRKHIEALKAPIAMPGLLFFFFLNNMAGLCCCNVWCGLWCGEKHF